MSARLKKNVHRAGIYVRLSSDPRGRGKSVAEQEADSRTDCDKQGWEVVDVYRDNNRSASRYATRNRENFDRLIADIRGRKLDVIVAWEASRFTRDTEVYSELAKACREAGVLLSYNGRVLDLNDPDDAFNAGLDALLSEREAGIVRKRIMRTHRFNAEAGLPHGQIAYGYRRIYDDKTGALLRQEPDPVEAPIVREVFRRVSQGESLRSLCRSLTDRKVPTPSGGSDWGSVSLRRLLERQQYLGKRVWNGVVMPDGGWEPLVSEEVFEACQRILSDPRRKAFGRSPEVKHLLSGILVCGECDAPMSVGPRNGIPSYVCRKGCVARKKELIEEPLTRLVIALLSDQRLAAGDDDEEVKTMLDEIESIDRDIAGLPDLVVSGDLSALIATAEQRRLEKRKVELQTEMRKLAPLPDVVVNASGPAAEANWAVLTTDERREVVRALFSSLRALRKKGRADIGRRAPGVTYCLSRDPEQKVYGLAA